ncbi:MULTISPECIES: hypothetical protein [unclassified Colwellia]|uniref:hypothetical protein n=1 Tax=unclassified Colwellia TaxID=196834 RepID=UPI0015F4EF27|nr:MULTISPECIES: hypothetical protein [unclassified Colwellia]MBA6231322.1 hypothetical protein [Colwellia sp. MB02u-7]MBA6234999.1 hypothetical protein [Colwellia sp. MB02u-11]MBA6298758.1 hypothetical protein [Colwellia sp. MB3u-22]MBA6309458.1 hypothetical protein [Colwellia sp. MB3u-64]
MYASASFRFLTLNEKQSKELITLIPTVEMGDHYESDYMVGCIKLIDNGNNEAIEKFRNLHSLKPTDCDIFVSITSEKRDEIWRAPKVVNNLINIVNCPLVFSYSC